MGLVRTYINQLRLQQSMRLRQQETEQLRAADALKNRFFTHITHAFRTPLTLILGPTEQQMSKQAEPRNQRRLQSIEQNAHQLL